MGSGRAIPIVVGVGDIKNRSQKIEDAIEPMKLTLQATQAAIKDTGLSPSAAKEFQASIDSVGVVNTWSWNYSDLPGLISENLGINPRYKGLSHHGGDSPAKFFDEAARRISFRESRVAIITGGEALASCEYLECLSDDIRREMLKSGKWAHMLQLENRLPGQKQMKV